jgi:hypothetical protein
MALPELVMVRGRELVAPTCVEGKLNEVADNWAMGPATAVPVIATACGEFPALSVTLSVALNDPAAVGVKVTCAVQWPPGAIGLPPQLLVWLNRLPLAPVWLMADTLRVVVPELVMVRGSVVVDPTCVDAKLSEVGEKVTAGPPVVAVPVTAIDCGEPVTLSVTFNVAVNVPPAVGVKVTCAVQELPAASGLPPQLLVWV